MIDMELLRSYENGPRIWDASAVYPKVVELADAGLVEPVDGGPAWKITQAGLDALEAYDELGPTTVQAEPSVPIDGIDVYDFHNAVAVLVERREPFTVTAGDGRPLARVEPVPAANFMTQALSSGSLAELRGRLTALADDLREQGHQVTWDGQAMIVEVRAPGAGPAPVAEIMGSGFKWRTSQEIDALVRGYDDDRLQEQHALAAEEPGTEWHRVLLAEMRRRGRTVQEPVTLDELVPGKGVELKGDCALWNDGALGMVLGPYVTGSVRVRVERSGIIVQARPENIARLVSHL